MNSVTKFEVHFDKEDLTFRDGEYMTGFVELNLNEDLKYKSISFELKGYSIICWDGMSNTTSPDPMSADVFREHCSEKCVMLDKIGNFLDKDPVLPAGEHVLPFEVRIPKEVPSSFEGQYGRVQYEGRGVIERPSSGFKANKVTLSRHDLIVLAALDLSKIPEASYKIEICKYKELGLCCTEGSLTIDWVVDKSGFIPTEEILINGSIQNDSKHAIGGSSVSLIMVVEYKLKKRRLIDRVRIANLERGGISSDDVAVWNDRLVVPSCPPSSLGRSKTVDVSYELEFKVMMEDSHSSPICYNKTVYIGTVMLAQQSTGAPQLLAAYPQTLMTAEMFVPCYAPLPTSGVILTSPPRTNDVAGFYGNHNAGFDSFSRGDEDDLDVPLEDRPPPYAPGHNPEELDRPCTSRRSFPFAAGGMENDAPVRSADKPDSIVVSRTLCIRGESSAACDRDLELPLEVAGCDGGDDDGRNPSVECTGDERVQNAGGRCPGRTEHSDPGKPEVANETFEEDSGGRHPVRTNLNAAEGDEGGAEVSEPERQLGDRMQEVSDPGTLAGESSAVEEGAPTVAAGGKS